jgi:hypothetical protein
LRAPQAGTDAGDDDRAIIGSGVLLRRTAALSAALIVLRLDRGRRFRLRQGWTGNGCHGEREGGYATAQDQTQLNSFGRARLPLQRAFHTCSLGYVSANS